MFFGFAISMVDNGLFYFYFVALMSGFDVVLSFVDLITESVTFSSEEGSSLTQNVYFNLMDDFTALESIEIAIFLLDLSGASRTRVGQNNQAVLNILDDDGMMVIFYNVVATGII